MPSLTHTLSPMHVTRYIQCLKKVFLNYFPRVEDGSRNEEECAYDRLEERGECVILKLRRPSRINNSYQVCFSLVLYVQFWACFGISDLKLVPLYFFNLLYTTLLEMS